MKVLTNYLSIVTYNLVRTKMIPFWRESFKNKKKTCCRVYQPDFNRPFFEGLYN